MIETKVTRRKPEVKSPAGHWPQLHAAIEAGADGVYFGLKHFTARAKAGFDLEELPEALRTLHARGVRGYVTFNTLLFEHELKEAARVIATIAEAGADGLIVQDLTAVRLAREIAPEMKLHGSTQMSITDARGVELARSLGVDRVTLARELSLEEIRAIAADSQCDLEIFVHGALCVAYSGQCFSSEAWGGRSANRGQCAQACRLPYELLVDGSIEPLADARYLLSPGDLYALRQIPEMVAAGIAALKIEGRYKDAEYVALTTRAYRQAVDEAWAGRPLSITPREELQLEQVYSRGLGPFFLTGTNHQTVVEGRAPRHRGVEIGSVTRVDFDRVTIAPAPANDIAPLKPGDGVVFDAASWRTPEDPEEGGRVFAAHRQLAGDIELQFGNGAIRFDRIHVGDLLWRTHDPEIDRLARPFLEASNPVARQRVNVTVEAREGEPLRSLWSLEKQPDISVQIDSPAPLDQAQNRGLTLATLREQFARLGNTAYELGDVTLNLEGSLFAAVSTLNQMRREAVEKLQAVASRPPHAEVHDPTAALKKFARPTPAAHSHAAPQIHLLVRTPEQLEAALTLAPASITLDYLDLYGLRPSIERVKASGIPARVASPRVLKPGEARILNFLIDLDCEILVRPAGLIHALRAHALRARAHAPLIGDFSLNIANSIAAELFLDLGLDRLTPTHDLNAAQVAALALSIGPQNIETIAYQHLPVFHTEHCVFCRFLSTGTSYRDCGRPCEKHRVSLQDSKGRAHPVLADVGCRNTVFGAEAQEASAHLDAWQRAGIVHYRLEFVHESPEQVRQVYDAFDAALHARATTKDLAAQLRRIAPQGTTEGSLFVPADYLTLPVLQ
ncbi:MAG: U32 family peptidase [Acidobacteriota bacterium]|nr:U32 family peptidase [Acidobacteriota bacterium]